MLFLCIFCHHHVFSTITPHLPRAPSNLHYKPFFNFKELIPGVIYEVAVKKCGGVEAMQAAMARGDVLVGKSENNLHTLYFFPKGVMGKQNSSAMDDMVTMKRITDESGQHAMRTMHDEWGFALAAPDMMKLHGKDIHPT